MAAWITRRFDWGGSDASPKSDLAGSFRAGPGADGQRQRQQSDRHDDTKRAGEAALVSERKVSRNTGILALDQAGQF